MLRTHSRKDTVTAMRQTSSLTHAMTTAQERHAAARRATVARDISSTVVYRIYTEDLPSVVRTVATVFPSFNVAHVDGVYNGRAERGAIVEIIATPFDRATVETLAMRVCVAGLQESVLVTVHDAHGLSSFVVVAPSLTPYTDGAAV